MTSGTGRNVMDQERENEKKSMLDNHCIVEKSLYTYNFKGSKFTA